MKSQIDALRQLTHELLYLGMDGEPIYADRFHQLNSEVYSQAEALYGEKTGNDEEEATLCITLLKAYSATIYNHGDKDEKIQELADEYQYPVRKLAHMTEYCLLAICVSLPLYVYGLRGFALTFLAGILCVAFAASDEFHQTMVANRGPSVKASASTASAFSSASRLYGCSAGLHSAEIRKKESGADGVTITKNIG